MSNDFPSTQTPVFLDSCQYDRDCSQSCCLEYDPGLVPLENLKTANFPTTKSKVCTNQVTIQGFQKTPFKENPGKISLQGTEEKVSVMCTDAVPPPLVCELDSDCPEKYFKGGCCMMIDPGKLPEIVLKNLGFATTKQKMCADVNVKLLIEDIKKQPTLYPQFGPDTQFNAYCDGSAKLPVACTSDTDCEKDFKGGCCAMVDPGNVPAGLLQARGFPTTKSKMCTDVLRKTQLVAQQALGQPQTISLAGQGQSVNAYCADSRLLQVAGLLSISTLVISSQLI